MLRKKIKILYTIPNFDTAGSGKVVYDLVKNLDRSIFEPEICCFHRKGAFMAEIEKLKVKIHIFPFSINYKPFVTFPIRLFKIVRFFRNEKFDIIHSWHWSSDFSEPLAAKITGIPWVFTKKSMGWGNKAWKLRSFLSSKIITVNSDMHSFFTTKKLKEKVVPIPFGVNTQYYSDKVSNASSNSLAIKENDFVIVSVVNLIPVKGIEFLIQAVLKLANPKIKLLIVGNDQTDYAFRLKEMVGSNSQISFLGKKMDVRPFHALANLFVIPTLELGEGLPMAPIEAMASGKIVIGSNVPGVKDILSNFPDCLFNPNDAVSLMNCINHILNLSNDDRINLGEQMKLHVNSEYAMERFILNNSNLYKKIILEK